MKKRRSRRNGAPLGQHFLTGQWAAAKLAESVGVRQGETILEIGPGKGALTEELLKTGARVLAIEKDASLVAHLNDRFRKPVMDGQLRIIEDDIRDFDPLSSQLEARSYVVAANIPYYITCEIIRKFLTDEHQPRTMALLVQKEVAERIANRKNPKESILSISVKAYGKPRIVAKVSRGNFSPPPQVDSAILLIENISRNFFDNLDEGAFFRVVRAGFSSKRKLLSANIISKFGFTKSKVGAAFTHCGIDEKSRAEDVPLSKWKCLTARLTATSFQLLGRHHLSGSDS